MILPLLFVALTLPADIPAVFAFLAFFGTARLDLFFGLDFLAMCGLYLRLAGLQRPCRPGSLPPVCGIMSGACSRLGDGGSFHNVRAFPAPPRPLRGEGLDSLEDRTLLSPPNAARSRPDRPFRWKTPTR